jgi:cytochrome b561
LAYDPIWKTIHWLTVALVVALLILGAAMSGGALFMWHASLGVTLFGLTLVRLAWRATHGAPPIPATLRPWEVTVLTLVQVLFYVLLLLQPLLGWAIYSLSPHYVGFFGLGALPKLPGLAGTGDVTGLRDILEGAHSTGAGLITALFALHAGAALRHHFSFRDDVLLRMAPASLAPFLLRLRDRWR